MWYLATSGISTSWLWLVGRGRISCCTTWVAWVISCQADRWTLEICWLIFHGTSWGGTFIPTRSSKNWQHPPFSSTKKKLRPFLKEQQGDFNMWGKKRGKIISQVIQVAPVTFKNFPKSWRSPTTAEFGSQITSRIAWRARRFLKRFAFFWKWGVDWNNTRVCFYFDVFFVVRRHWWHVWPTTTMIAKDFIEYFDKGSSFFRCLCQKNRPLLVSCLVLLGGELTDLGLKKMFFVKTLGPNFDYQDGYMGL